MILIFQYLYLEVGRPFYGLYVHMMYNIILIKWYFQRKYDFPTCTKTISVVVQNSSLIVLNLNCLLTYYKINFNNFVCYQEFCMQCLLFRSITEPTEIRISEVPTSKAKDHLVAASYASINYVWYIILSQWKWTCKEISRSTLLLKHILQYFHSFSCWLTKLLEKNIEY